MSSTEDFLKQDLKHSGDFEATNRGDLETIYGKANLRQAVYNRLVTKRGTIVHRPNYGVGLPTYQGALFNLENQRKLALDIQEQLRDEPRIKSVDGVKFTVNEDGSFILTLKYSGVGIGNVEDEIDPFDNIR